MTGVKIELLSNFTDEDLHQLGEMSYTANEKYRVVKHESDRKISIDLELIDLDKPYYKNYEHCEEDVEHYNKIVPLGFSLGAYIASRLVGVVIAEETSWNNTLFVWHMQVAEPYRKMNIGRRLLNELVSLAERSGLRAINLETQNTNIDAIRFYRSCGFHIEGVDLSLYTNHDTENGEVALFMKRKLVVK